VLQRTRRPAAAARDPGVTGDAAPLSYPGSQAALGGVVKWPARGTAKVKDNDGGSPIRLDMSGTTVKKYTLLPKE
jgi:hypothetical protein